MPRKRTRKKDNRLTITQLEDRKLLAADLTASLDTTLPELSSIQTEHQPTLRASRSTTSQRFWMVRWSTVLMKSALPN